MMKNVFLLTSTVLVCLIQLSVLLGLQITGRPPSTAVQVAVGSASHQTETVPESASPIWDRQVELRRQQCPHQRLLIFCSRTRAFVVLIRNSFEQIRIAGPDSTTMTVTLYDKSGSAPAPMGAATIPVGGNLGEGLLTLKVIGKDGLPVIGADQQHSQIELKVRCGQVGETSNLIPAGGHCGIGKTGTPDVYDSDCVTGYCAWVSLPLVPGTLFQHSSVCRVAVPTSLVF
jgi:hypothetical protein